MDAHRQRESLASIALGLMQQIAPGVFDQLPSAARQGVLASLAALDAAAEERSREDAAEAVLAAAALHRVTEGIDARRVAPSARAADTERAALAAAHAESCLAIGEASMTTAEPETPLVIGHPDEVAALALMSLAHSAREACMMMRAIVEAAERFTTPTMTVDGGG